MEYQANSNPLPNTVVTAPPPTAPTTAAMSDIAAPPSLRIRVRYVIQPITTPKHTAPITLIMVLLRGHKVLRVTVKRTGIKIHLRTLHPKSHVRTPQVN